MSRGTCAGRILQARRAPQRPADFEEVIKEHTPHLCRHGEPARPYCEASRRTEPLNRVRTAASGGNKERQAGHVAYSKLPCADQDQATQIGCSDLSYGFLAFPGLGPFQPCAPSEIEIDRNAEKNDNEARDGVPQVIRQCVT